MEEETEEEKGKSIFIIVCTGNKAWSVADRRRFKKAHQAHSSLLETILSTAPS